MFYLAEAFLISEGLSFSKHSAVISKFGQTFVKTNRLTSRAAAHVSKYFSVIHFLYRDCLILEFCDYKFHNKYAMGGF